jgi:hypothetical protein
MQSTVLILAVAIATLAGSGETRTDLNCFQTPGEGIGVLASAEPTAAPVESKTGKLLVALEGHQRVTLDPVSCEPC